MSNIAIEKQLKDLRLDLEKCFAAETVYFFNEEIPSTGHCAIVAAIIYKRFGGNLVSAYVDGIKHWFNKIDDFYIDLTGDQFGLDAVQIKKDLYKDCLIREWAHLNSTTLERLEIMEEKLLQLGR
jgi:hypothetical protein